MERDERWQALFKMVQRVIADQFKIGTDKVSSNLNILHTFKADSLDVLQIIMRIEERLNLEIPDEDARRFSTVRDATEYLYGKGATV